MPFDPKVDKFPYPAETDKHYLLVKKNNGNVYDKNYPYVDKSKKFLRKRGFFYFLCRLIVFPLVKIRFNMKIVGKENLRKYKDVLDKGFLTVCNHVHMWDYLGIMRALKPRRPNTLSWAPNISGENGFLIRMVGGIPIPTEDLRAEVICFKEVLKLLESGGWLHIYAEGSMWEFYQPIRPFKPGCAYFAIKANKPILPLAYSYRENGWIRKKIFHSPAAMTLHIGEPIYPDQTLGFKEAENKLTIEAHEAVCRLAGIDPKENLYPPIFKDSKRVDYYTSEYGKGYKTSW
ncbi:MAG: 1-acyl-sn-glycerol-3-phosphate acyltransferase [Bacilli bacterium]|nr:1-acyl-sn-glycerol-3-phosphate acyltransferase [Bacilli bacterium]